MDRRSALKLFGFMTMGLFALPHLKDIAVIQSVTINPVIDYDFRIENSTANNLIYVDASSDVIRIA